MRGRRPPSRRDLRRRPAAATEGHDICAEDPWVNGAVTDQQRALAFHPFAAEQAAVAEAVVAAVGR